MGGGWSDKTKLILISTLVEVLVEVEVELGKNNINLLAITIPIMTKHFKGMFLGSARTTKFFDGF